MKKIAFFIIAAFICHSSFAQTEVTVEQGGTRVIRGLMTREDLKKDSSFSWFAQNGYAPEAGALQAFRTQKDSINIVVFGGTWCGDTKSLLPKFFSLTDAAGFSADRVTLIGVDRSKKTVHHLAEAFGVTNVPTFIVMKNGKEVGRVVEYGKTGMFDKELGEIIAGKK